MRSSLLIFALVGCAGDPAARMPEDADTETRLVAGTALLQSESLPLLRQLAEEIGPRLTGTDACARAERWAAERMRTIGLENVHLEEYSLAERWAPGELELELVSPEHHQLAPVQLMWTGSTEPVEVSVRRVDSGMLPSDVGGQLVVVRTKPAGNAIQVFRDMRQLLEQAQAGGARGLLFLSDNRVARRVLAPDPGGLEGPGVFSIPAARLNAADSGLLERLLAHGPVRARFLARPQLAGRGVAHNVVGDVKGIGGAELVMLGAHLDSAAGSPGAFDDGGGVVTVLETARLVRSSPAARRTLRAVLFTGEELGLVGARAYVRRHAAELGSVSAMVQIDGEGLLWTEWMTFGRADVTHSLEPLLRQLRGSGAATARSSPFSPFFLSFSDHAPFALEGVPTLFPISAGAKLALEVPSHTPDDVVDRVPPGFLAYSTATVTAVVQQLLNAPYRLAPRMSADEVRAWVTQEHFEPDAWMAGRSDLLGAH